jgi:hypothetical protein
MGWFEIYSGQFPAGQICLGGNGCTAATDADGGCSNYVVFVGPQDLEPNIPGSGTASARYFDGDSDYVVLPRMDGGGGGAGIKKGAFETLTVDTVRARPGRLSALSVP